MIDKLAVWIKNNEWLATTLLNATMLLLGLGVAAKIGAALFYGLGKVIGVVGAVTRAYTFISTLAALSNVSLASATLSATSSMWSFVAAELAVLAPLGLVISALGVLALAYKVVSDATRKTMFTTVDSYKKGDASIKYSTVVMQSEFDKQFNLMKSQRDRINAFNGKAVNVGGIGVKKGGIYNLNYPFMDVKESKTPFADEQNKRPMGFAQSLSNYGQFLPNFSSEKPIVKPENLAGKSETKFSLPKIGGELKITVDSKDGSKAEIDDSQVEGIKVYTGKNQGSR
jgi:hypothetical protein